MKSKKVILYGSRGWLGQQIMDALESHGYPTYRGDYRKGPREQMEQICDLRPEMVVNAAAYVAQPSVRYNDLEKHRTMQANGVWPAVLGALCHVASTPLLHISTGCLWRSGIPKSEIAEPELTLECPKALCYTQSKVVAEMALWPKMEAWCLRIRLPFNNRPNDRRNFLVKIQEYPSIHEWGHPQSLTSVKDLCRAIIAFEKKRPPFGIYNCTNTGGLTFTHLAKLVQWSWGAQDWKPKMKKMTPQSCAGESHCELDNLEISRFVKMPTAEDAVIEALKNPCYV